MRSELLSSSQGFPNFWLMTPHRVTLYVGGVTGDYLLIYRFTDVGNVLPNEEDNGLERG